MVGCTSTGTQRAESAVAGSDALQAEYVGLKEQIDKTTQALDGVVAAKGGDLRSAYDGYVSELQNLESQAQTVVDRSADLNARTEAYVAGWEEEMAEVRNPAIREHAKQRRAEAEKKFADAQDELARIQKDYEEFVTSLRDIKIVLENDLNPTGVVAIEKLVAKAKEGTVPVKADIDEIIAGLDRVSAALSARGPEASE
jgi:DNA helicase IV